MLSGRVGFIARQDKVYFKGRTGLQYLGSGRVQNIPKFKNRVGLVSYMCDTQVPTNYCALLYRLHLDFKLKIPLSIYQAKTFSCLSKIL